MIVPINSLLAYIFKFRDWYKKNWIHILAWALFIFYEAFMVGMIKGTFGTIPNYIIHYAYNIIFFYFHAHVLLSYSFKRSEKAILRALLLILSELVLYVTLVFVIDTFLAKYTNVLRTHSIPFNKALILGYFWRGFYFIFFSTGYYFFLRYIQERNEKEEAQKQKLEAIIKQEQINKELAEAKNSFLLAQINPHFLFNTLNYIYYTAYKTSPKSAEAIMALSKIMRYAANAENTIDFVFLSEEIEYVETLIYLHQLRYEHALKFSFDYSDDSKQIKIIPLILITITENIFKHGHLTHTNYPPYIKIHLNDAKDLIMETGNIKKREQNSTGLHSGLSNIENRLQFAYNGKAKMEYNLDERNFFTLKITIPDLKSI